MSSILAAFFLSLGCLAADPAKTSAPEPIPQSPKSFWFDYEGYPSPGKRTWTMISNDTWTEEYGNGIVSHFKVNGRDTVNGVSGTVATKFSGDAKDTLTENDNAFQVFIPDLGTDSPRLWCRNKRNGEWEKWKGLKYPLQGMSDSASDEKTANADRFHSAAAGFSVTKPSSWNFASAEQIAEHQSGVRYPDKELEEMVRTRARTPLVVLLKHPQPFEGINPSVQISIRPLGPLSGTGALELMANIVPTMQRGMGDFTFIDKMQETKVSGFPAAYMKAAFTAASPQGGEFKSLIRLWLVPRGRVVFMIGMSGPSEGPDISEDEFTAILESISIEN